MISLSPSVLSFLKGLGLSLLTALLSYLSVASNLTGIVPAVAVPIVIGVVALLESALNKKTGVALFGIARAK